MKIGLLVTSIGNFGQKGFYNSQEIGLAKELNKIVDEVVVYKLISADQEEKNEKIAGSRTATLHMIPAKSIGINGFFDMRIIDTRLDVLVYFSDTQMMVLRVAKWAKRHHVTLFPYIGVLESHSANMMVRKLINLLFKRNLAVYRTLHCFVKTPDVENRLRAYGVNNITVIPVGLDISLLHNDSEQIPRNKLKEKYNYSDSEKVLLFIGRFVQEKQPERMIDIFRAVYEKDNSYKMLMVGTGELRKDVEDKVRKLNLEKQVKFVDRIPNNNIWELYRIADVFVNLNQQEIFGMAILESMYYGCKVVAMHAPGPDYIIDNGVSGILCETNQEIENAICDIYINVKDAKKLVIQKFTWNNSVILMMDIIRGMQINGGIKNE